MRWLLAHQDQLLRNFLLKKVCLIMSKLVKDHNGIGKHHMKHVDIGCSHIETYSLDMTAPVLSHFLEKTAEHISISVFCPPEKSFPAQVIVLCMIDMTTTPTDLANPFLNRSLIYFNHLWSRYIKFSTEFSFSTPLRKW